jgi:hypothetical protein
MAGLLFLIIMGVIYFIPSVIANNRKHRQFTAIFILNLFFGWTLIGWVGALIWAVMND